MTRRALAVLALVATLAVPGTGCALFRKTKSSVADFSSGSDLYRRGMAELERHHLTKAKTLFEAVQFSAESRPTLEPAVRIALADVVFYTGDDLSLIDARSKYLEFVTLYGDNPLAPYAQFQAGVCALKQIVNPSRDQSQTRVAIEDLREIEKRWPASPYARASRTMIRTAEANMAEHEYIVGRFYLRRRAYLSASERFRGILEKYPDFAEKDKVYFDLGRSLILAKNRAEGSIYLDKLVADFPNGPYTAMAKRLLADASAAVGAERKSGRS